MPKISHNPYYVLEIQEADPESAVGQAQGLLSELIPIKNYAKRYHHPAGADAPGEPIDANEVLAYGTRALKIVQAF